MDHPPADFMFAPRTFIRIYRLPNKLTNGYCFGGGVPITFQNEDWFEVRIAEDRALLVDALRKKKYYDPASRFLVLGDHPDWTFIIEPSGAVEQKGND